MANIFIPEYWPLFKTTERRRFDYGSFSSVFSYDAATDSMIYADYDDKGVWKDSWFYQYRPGFGIAEWRDDYPGKKVVMDPPIGWAEYAEIGSVYTNNPQMSFWKSWPPQFGSGKQTVVFEALHSVFISDSGVVYHDVLQFTYQQKWGSGLQTGARYFFAKGIGPVSVQWIGLAPTGDIVQSERIDAKPLLVS